MAFLFLVIAFLPESAQGGGATPSLTIRIGKEWVPSYGWFGIFGADTATPSITVQCNASLAPGSYTIQGRVRPGGGVQSIVTFNWDGTQVTNNPQVGQTLAINDTPYQLQLTGVQNNPTVPVSGGFNINGAVISGTAAFTNYTLPATLFVGNYAPQADPNATTPYDECLPCWIENAPLISVDPSPGAGDNLVGMARYTFNTLLASLRIQDTPLTYKNALGPQVKITLTYVQRAANVPSLSGYSSVGPNWNFNWMSFITLPADPATSGTVQATLQPPGGGAIVYGGFNSTTNEFALDLKSQSILQRVDAGHYEQLFKDGSKYIYAQSHQWFCDVPDPAIPHPGCGSKGKCRDTGV